MRMTHYLLTAAAVLLLSPAGHAQARPEMAKTNAQERFVQMDADKNNIVSKEEFFAAQPQMREAAFNAIDTDGNGSISPQEWEAFMVGHAMGAQAPGQAQQGNATAPKKHDLVMPSPHKD